MLMQVTARRFTASSSRKDLFEVSSATINLNNRWCWIPFSSAISSDPSAPQRRRRVTKHERHAMVLAFVEKYMVSNAGKFPSASCIQKQVGGSYYVIREISQKLEYSWKTASPETRKVFMPGKAENVKVEDEPDIIAAAKQISSEEYAAHPTEVTKGSSLKVEGIERFSINSNLSLCPQIDVDVLRQAISDSLENNNVGFDNVCASSSASVGATTKLQTHKSLETTDAGEGKFRVPDKLKTQTTDLLAPAEERGEVREDANSTVNSQNAYVSMQEMMNNEEVSRSEEVNHWEQQSIGQNASSTKGLDLWGNLKSMALGIIYLWKR